MIPLIIYLLKSFSNPDKFNNKDLRNIYSSQTPWSYPMRKLRNQEDRRLGSLEATLPASRIIIIICGLTWFEQLK